MVTGHRQRDFIFTRATVVLGMYSYKIVKLTLSCIGILSFNSVKYKHMEMYYPIRQYQT